MGRKSKAEKQKRKAALYGYYAFLIFVAILGVVAAIGPSFSGEKQEIKEDERIVPVAFDNIPEPEASKIYDMCKIIYKYDLKKLTEEQTVCHRLDLARRLMWDIDCLCITPK